MRGHTTKGTPWRALVKRIRFHTTVIAPLLLLFGILATVPAVAAEPQADYVAVFDACSGMPSSRFIDTPRHHPSAGDIDCIAYYGITKGTSEGRFEPSRSVSREHMTLFLTRLAKLMGISMVSNPVDPRFEDINHLSGESQTAIAQLADLGITRGTSATTFSPSAHVKRGHMALFIQRLMNQMDPMTDGGIRYGFVPSDVAQGVNNSPTSRPESPFTDLGNATKDEYDAITQLWELGVVRGVSNTTYAPGSAITRAAMAEMIAAALDHSNVRPAGLTIQATRDSNLRGGASVVAVSYRDSQFAPVAYTSIKMLDTETIDELADSDTCRKAQQVSGAGNECDWYAQVERTDPNGNCFVEGWAADGRPNTYIAWVDSERFDSGSDAGGEVTVTVASQAEATGIKVTSDLPAHALRTDTPNDSDHDPDEPRVNLDQTRSVTFTAQLVNDTGTPIAEAGVTITVGLEQRRFTDGQQRAGPIVYSSASEQVLTTNGAGFVRFTVFRPTSTRGADNDQGRADTVTFLGSVSPGRSAPEVEATGKVIWADAAPVYSSGRGSVSASYALIVGGKVPVRAAANLFDQYGNSIGRGYTVSIGIGNQVQSRQRVSSRGLASLRRSVNARVGDPVTVTFTDIQNARGERTTPAELPSITVTPVVFAEDGSSRSSTNVGAVFPIEKRFHLGGALYRYDRGDTFIHDGEMIDLDEFETRLGADLDLSDDHVQTAQVEVVLYNSNGTSIFRVTRVAEGESAD